MRRLFSNRRNRQQLRTRLGLDMLEARDVPAVLIAGEPNLIAVANSYSTNYETVSVAADADGDHVVVWRSTDSTPQILAQRYDKFGAAVGSTIVVSGSGAEPDVAMDAAGNFVVTWKNDTSNKISACGYTASGSLFSTFAVEGNGETFQLGGPEIAMSDDGAYFAITYIGKFANASNVLFARKYTVASTPQPVPIDSQNRYQIEPPAAGYTLEEPDVSMNETGDFAVVWHRQTTDLGVGTTNYILIVDNQPVDLDLSSNVQYIGQIGTGRSPTVAMDDDGRFVAAWSTNSLTPSQFNVYYRRFGTNGQPVDTNPVLVSTNTYGDHYHPAVAADADGDFVVSWLDDGGFGTAGTKARAFSWAGVPDSTMSGGNEFVVDEDYQTNDVTMDAAGNFVVGFGRFETSETVSLFTQRYRRSGAPTVASIQVNAGQTNTTQRSRVTSVTVTFDSQLTFAGATANAFTLTRNGTAIGSFTATASIVNGVTVVTLTAFGGANTDYGSLADGYFTLGVIADQVHNAYGVALDGNADGYSGDDFTRAGTKTNGMFRLFGDATGDGTVNAADSPSFMAAYGTSTGDAAYRDYFDFNNDGYINASDYGQFVARYGISLP